MEEDTLDEEIQITQKEDINEYKMTKNTYRKQKVAREKKRREKQKWFDEVMQKGRISENRNKKLKHRKSGNMILTLSDDEEVKIEELNQNSSSLTNDQQEMSQDVNEEL